MQLTLIQMLILTPIVNTFLNITQYSKSNKESVTQKVQYKQLLIKTGPSLRILNTDIILGRLGWSSRRRDIVVKSKERWQLKYYDFPT